MSITELAQQFRIPLETLAAAGVRDIADAEARELLGQHGFQGCDLGGVAFTIRHPLTDAVVGHRVRLEHPTTGGGKYLAEPGSRWLFVAPMPNDWLTDASVPVAFVEAEKSALALGSLAERAGRKLVPIATGGCWGWKRNDGKRPNPDGTSGPQSAPSPTLDLLAWEGREAIVAFDSNASTSPKVRSARRKLAEHLAGRGASVRLAEVPSLEGVNGPDDLVAVSGDDAALAMLDAARPFADCALADAEAAVATLEADRKADPLAVLEAVAAVGDDSRRALLVGKLAELRVPGLTKAVIEKQVREARAEAAESRKQAAEAARRGRLLSTAVDGAAVLNEIADFLRVYMRMTESQIVAVVLCCANSYVFRLAMYCAIVHVTAPEKESGKSRLLELIRLFVWQPWMTGRTTAANLVAKCAGGCTLLLDEADAAMEQDREYVAALRGILDCRFEADKPASMRVPAPDGGWQSKDLDVYGPTFMAGIGALPDTIASRAIAIVLRRQPKANRAEKFRKRKVQPVAEPIRERLEAWMLQIAERLRDAEPAMPNFRDRQEDIIEQLLGIADLAGGDWPRRAREAFREIFTAEACDDGIGARLLADCKRIFEGEDLADPEADSPPLPVDRIASEDLAARLGQMESSPWSEWGKQQKPISKAQLARRLGGPGRFGISPKTLRLPDGRRLSGYERDQFREAWDAYLIPATAPNDGPTPIRPVSKHDTATTRVNTGPSGDVQSVTPNPCHVSENGTSPNREGQCHGVTDKIAGNGGVATPKAIPEPVWAGEEL